MRPVDDLPPLEPKVSFSRDVYRNIYTIIDSQHLFDDLDIGEDEASTLFAWDNASSQIDHEQAQKNRIFQYHDPATSSMAVFDSGARRIQSRFSDGSYGVWYGALDQETSIRETLFHCLRFAKADLKNASGSIKNERVMFQVACSSSNAVDLCGQVDKFPDLVHLSDYAFCQRIGAACKANGIEMLQTMSARKEGGICVPVFTPSVIKHEKKIYYLRYEFSRDGQAIISTIDNREVEIPKDWGLT